MIRGANYDILNNVVNVESDDEQEAIEFFEGLKDDGKTLKGAVLDCDRLKSLY